MAATSARGSIGTSGGSPSPSPSTSNDGTPAARPKTKTSSIPMDCAARSAASADAAEATRTRAPTSLSWAASSLAVYRALTVVTMPPASIVAKTAMGYSSAFGLQIATTWPLLTPRRARPAAVRRTALHSSPYVRQRPVMPSTSAGFWGTSCTRSRRNAPRSAGERLQGDVDRRKRAACHTMRRAAFYSHHRGPIAGAAARDGSGVGILTTRKGPSGPTPAYRSATCPRHALPLASRNLTPISSPSASASRRATRGASDL